tara:strand:+ start:22426 stop:22731 length:306 start_codon:yes stop_codon:yes gene_type:complete
MKDNRYGKLSRYHYGVTYIEHKGVKVSTSVGTEMDNAIETMPVDYNYKLGKVPLMFENRPDNISNIFYDSPKHWWLVMQFNGFNDPFEFFGAGEEIRIPEL